MPELFETTHLNQMALKNRFIRSATWMGLAREDGACTPQLTERLTELAEGGVGLIITGHAYVEKRGQAGPRQLGIYCDEQIAGLERLTTAIHDCGGKVIVQLAHAGMYADPKLICETPVGPSTGEGFVSHPARKLSSKEIEEVVDAFVQAAHRAKTAGFDGIQLHIAHGYLLNQFLSPGFNRREDEYGGVIENRCRILCEILYRIRKTVGDDYPLLVKINSQDFFEGGLSLADSVDAGKRLEKLGLDAIEVSGGTRASGHLKSSRTGIVSIKDEAYFQNEAKSFKAALNIPIILVGGIRSYTVANKLLSEHVADYISLCRPFIREPNLIQRWKRGDLGKSGCLSDGSCLEAGLNGSGVCCTKQTAG